jgi:3-oxoacyl-[acyl-carrier protein] reductase
MRNVLVTGGSRGLGLAISLKLADTGCHVMALARNESRELASAIAASEKPVEDGEHELAVRGRGVGLGVLERAEAGQARPGQASKLPNDR